MNTQRGTSTPVRPKGFALPAAIFGLVVVGVLVTGGFYIARQETRIGIANRQATEAFYLAERGLNEVVEEWNVAAFNAQANWTQTTFRDTLPEGVWEVEVTKMSDWTYLLDAVSTMTRGGEEMGGATRRMGMVAKFSTANIDPPAALTTRGRVTIAGGALVSGYDVNPAGWTQCPPAADDKTGVLTDLDGEVDTNGGGATEGSPPEAQSADVTDATFNQFGELTWADLIGMATWHFNNNTNFSQVGPVETATGTCDISVNTNWGDPTDPFAACGSWFPIVYVNGDATIQGGGTTPIGQGMLLVEGDLQIQGGFIYHGIVIIQGQFDARGSSSRPRILGGVLASNAVLDPERLTGQSLVQYSSCAVTQALLNNPNLTRVRPLAQRSWVDLTNLSN